MYAAMNNAATAAETCRQIAADVHQNLVRVTNIATAAEVEWKFFLTSIPQDKRATTKDEYDKGTLSALDAWREWIEAPQGWRGWGWDGVGGCIEWHESCCCWLGCMCALRH